MMEKIKADLKLPQDIKDLQKVFTLNGFSLFVVGGAVRDYLLGKEPHDFDLVTNATPVEVIEILSDYNTDLQGEQFGVVRVFTKDEPSGHEIASYRKDISGGRDNKSEGEKVEVGNHITIKDDVQRRDITINAMFFDIEKQEIIDLVGGIDDLKSGIIRAVGDASKRFIEDRLRILRVIRFSSTYGFTIDSDTELAIRKDNRLFGISREEDVSKERIIGELLKVEEKSQKNPAIFIEYFKLMYDFGILDIIFPNAIITLDMVGSSNLAVALSQLLHRNINKTLLSALKFTKVPNKLTDTIINLVTFINEGITIDNFYRLHISYSRNPKNFIALKHLRDVRGIKSSTLDAFLKFKITVDGNDIMKEGFKGKEIGLEKLRREKENFLKLI